MSTELKLKIYNLLKSENMTIPAIAEKLNIDDDYIVSKIIVELEYNENINLIEFKPVYHAYGGLFHLAVYGVIT